MKASTRAIRHPGAPAIARKSAAVAMLSVAAAMEMPELGSTRPDYFKYWVCRQSPPTPDATNIYRSGDVGRLRAFFPSPGAFRYSIAPQIFLDCGPMEPGRYG